MAITRTTRHRRGSISPARSAPASSIRASRPGIAAGDCAASRARESFADRLRQLPAEPRPDRQPRARRPAGSASRKPKAIEAALAITLLAPTMPMLFMGEEWGSKAPFPFFCDFKGELADAVRQGRRKEFASAYDKYGDDIPDPLDDTDFRNRRCWTGPSTTEARPGPDGWRWSGSCSRSAARNRSAAGRRARSARAEVGGRRFARRRAGAWAMATMLSLIANLSDQISADGSPERPAELDLGRRVETRACRLVGVLAHRIDMMPPAIPIATYRLQLTADFDFDDAAARRALSEGARHHAISMPRPS